MKITAIIIFFICYNFTYSQQTVNPFLESIVKQFPNVRDTAILGNKDEVYFSAQNIMGNASAIIIISKKGNHWNNPEVASFSGQYFDIEPFLSSDGLTLYFASNRPLDSNSKEVKDFDIWYVKRQSIKDAWSEPINMGSPVNSKNDEFFPSLTENKNIYFTMDNPQLNKKDDIYVSEYHMGKYTTPIPLDNSINSDGYEFNAYVSSDETFMIYTCYGRKDGFGSGDLYISYKSDNGWTESKNLGDSINSNKMDYCPFIDTKSNILYFTSKRDNSKTSFNKPKTLDELLKEFYKYDNGLSRLYQVSVLELLTQKL